MPALARLTSSWSYLTRGCDRGWYEVRRIYDLSQWRASHEHATALFSRYSRLDENRYLCLRLGERGRDVHANLPCRHDRVPGRPGFPDREILPVRAGRDRARRDWQMLERRPR